MILTVPFSRCATPVQASHDATGKLGVICLPGCRCTPAVASKIKPYRSTDPDFCNAFRNIPTTLPEFANRCIPRLLKCEFALAPIHTNHLDNVRYLLRIAHASLSSPAPGRELVYDCTRLNVRAHTQSFLSQPWPRLALMESQSDMKAWLG